MSAPGAHPDARPLLIVNADDLGRTPGINEGIFAAHREGIVTSATLMVGFDGAAEAARRLDDHPGLGVGLHVTLSGTRPTLPGDRFRHLVDGEGRLPRRPERATGPLAANQEAVEALSLRREGGGGPGDSLDERLSTVLDEVRIEVRHQVERFRELTGRWPTHLDSHHHSHRLPVVLEVLVELALELGLPVRNASPAVLARLRRAAVPTTDLFVETFYAERTGAEDLRGMLESAARELRPPRSRSGPGAVPGAAASGDPASAVGGAGSSRSESPSAPPPSVELMCHPARVDAPLAAASTYTSERERELATLTDPAVHRFVDELGFRLGHFGDLARPMGSSTGEPASRGPGESRR